MSRYGVLCLAIAVSLAGCVHVEATRNQNIFAANEDCKLGWVMVASNTTTTRRCVRFTPNLTRTACKDWTQPDVNHRSVIDELAPSGATIANRMSRVSNFGAHALNDGELALFKGATEIALRVPQTANGTAKVEAVDLVALLRLAYIELSGSQLACMNAQTNADVSAGVATIAGESIEGFVIKGNIGFAHTLYLTSANLAASDNANVVNFDASALSLSTKVRGSIDDAYLDGLNKLLSTDLKGVPAAIAGTKIALMAPHVTGAETIELVVQKFPFPRDTP